MKKSIVLVAAVLFTAHGAWARYYDPETGRFLSRDPGKCNSAAASCYHIPSAEEEAADAPGLHKYSYARGNPLRYVDPDGRRDETIVEADQVAALARMAAAAQQERLSNWGGLLGVWDSLVNGGVAPDAAVLQHRIAEMQAAIVRAEDYGNDPRTAPDAVEPVYPVPARDYMGQGYVNVDAHGVRVQAEEGLTPYSPVFGEPFVQVGRRTQFVTQREFEEQENNSTAYYHTIGTEQALETVVMVGIGAFKASPTTGAPPAWLERMNQGNVYNKAHTFDYAHRELYVDNGQGGYNRVDAYDPGVAIVSRKFTQLGSVTEETAIRYVSEAAAKYAPGSLIADVPSSGPLAGQPLRGQLILEVPEQRTPIPPSVLNAAQQNGVTIRDVNGRVY